MTKQYKVIYLRFLFACIRLKNGLYCVLFSGVLRCIPDIKTALKALKWLVRYPHFAPETPMKPIFFTPKIFKEDL